MAPPTRPGGLAPGPNGGRQLQHRRTQHVALHVLVDERSSSGSTGAAKPSQAQATPPQVPAGSAPLWAYAALFGVAVLWGSYPPALKVLYAIDTPPDPPLMNALQACLSAAFLVAATLTTSLTAARGGGHGHSHAPHPERLNPLMAEDSAILKATLRRDKDAAVAAAAAAQPPPSSTTAPAAPPLRPPTNAIEHAVASALTWRSPSLTVAGAEIGLWMSLAFGLEVAGLQLTSATKVAFLNQVSVLITPLLVHLSGEHVRRLEWIACGLGLMGSILVAADSLMSAGGAGGAHGHHHGAAADGVAGGSAEVLGMVFVLVSAVFFALSTVRLGRYSSQFDSLKLSTASMCTLGVLSLAWVGAAVIDAGDGGASEAAVLASMAASPVCVLTALWVGLGPGALAAFLQATGQKAVPPAQAQVIYSTTPLWAAGFALVALDAADEAMGPVAWAGAAVMLVSSLLSALVPPPTGGGGGAPSGGGPASNTDRLPSYSLLGSIDSDVDEELGVGYDARAGRPLVRRVEVLPAPHQQRVMAARIDAEAQHGERDHHHHHHHHRDAK